MVKRTTTATSEHRLDLVVQQEKGEGCPAGWRVWGEASLIKQKSGNELNDNHFSAASTFSVGVIIIKFNFCGLAHYKEP